MAVQSGGQRVAAQSGGQRVAAQSGGQRVAAQAGGQRVVAQSEGQRVGLCILGEHKIEHNFIIIALCTALEFRATAAYQYSRVINTR